MEDKDNLRQDTKNECEKKREYIIEDIDDLIFRNELVKTHSER